MNTRKPSERTDRRHNSTISTRPGTNARLRNTVLSLILAVVLLAGCSTGSAPEAQRGKVEDAERESVIGDMQATHTWNLINSTPESTPDATEEPE